ncbi:MAG: bifunctional (p)ppGpp synthetase/guanosine-3',5'-bis(diphosphate) 3'-pyrophosphohydrolase [Gammaproteobacteria bacterium]|jgi:RelA/SpoT family (p)ppGpp synthetase|nr:bifunctional (p)ppGpp synthetase/guanosine-3',5'-bis(diphosphate) 3'-pyrophosphohydrolase [Gammaproteobacteria bacterium]MBT3718954.1 bifunctional (p)ppGpp synthetase/guanosine-3',5'-bis(diphosphate) 3'-pyrophosphohydrolase [Gammaproteobacteria bacterium]MBT3845406.1 bifunctional (p)ppGpp synthetase/guanosine-3',5'-bis(diphosphate) 3'-pyrophosphohydrolase [Gammaproteobacteria bacterium]MBT3892976.1 bifunctional (p)ppGpp synthetase/guanosine-3',5'-bis(diphosphate) 3'-pyrophosphohydrolase [Gamm
MFLISDLLTILESYLEQEQVRKIYAAYLFSAEAHNGQSRLTGEPYIYHPIEVARILAEMHIDHTTIIAALLHDVLEDTDHSKRELTERFGSEVTELVDGVSKLTRIQMESPQQAQAENFRKMMLAMTRDIRVILIKLADRLHNMRTLDGLKSEKRRRIAQETLEIHVPIAHRLGMNKIAKELRELGFYNRYPMRARVLAEAVKQARGYRKEILETIEVSIRRRLLETEIEAEVSGREKHLYSVYKKMKDQQLPFSEIFDVYAFRILVPSVEACYQTLGIVHSIYKPVPGKFKDYIAIPKANGYQSLHTILFGPHGVPVEIQIRTQEMHLISEEGIAAHWDYKSSGEGSAASNINSTEKRARQWLQDLLDLQKNSGNSLEFLESVKIDLFPDEVYIFTPKGKIMEFPRGATALDFAYRIHTEIGNHAVAARINRKPAPLNTHLFNGQTVEITTSPDNTPHPGWLQFVTTGKARSNIRHFLKNLQQEEAIQLGEKLLLKALSGHNISKKRFKKLDLNPLLVQLQVDDLNALYNEIGMGRRMAELVSGSLIQCCLKSSPGNEDWNDSSKKVTRWRNPLSMLSPLLRRRLHGRNSDAKRPLMIQGAEGMVVHFAKCCRPIAGDPIIGHISSGKGLVIHRNECNNNASMQSHPEQWVSVEWSDYGGRDLPTEIRVEVANKRGVLAIIASTISEMDSNIDHVSMDDQDGRTNTLTFTLRVTDRKHLAAIMRKVRKLKPVSTIQRLKG